MKETRNLTFFYNVGIILKQAGNISDENVQITSYSSRHSWKLERRTLEQCQPNQKSHVPALHALHSPFQFVLERNCIKILNGSISIYHWCRLWFGLSSRLGLRCAPDPLPLTHNGDLAREIGRTEGRTDGRKDPFALYTLLPYIRSFLVGRIPLPLPRWSPLFQCRRHPKTSREHFPLTKNYKLQCTTCELKTRKKNTWTMPTKPEITRTSLSFARSSLARSISDMPASYCFLYFLEGWNCPLHWNNARFLAPILRLLKDKGFSNFCNKHQNR